MTASDTHRAINAVFRIESPRLIAGLSRIVRDVGIAEELAQEALVAALEQWPQAGVPDKPGAWLMATAKHRAIDELRRRKRTARKHELRRPRRRRLDSTGALPSCPPARSNSRRAHAERAGGSWLGRAHGDPSIARGGAGRRGRRTHFAPRPKPRPLGSPSHPSRARGAR